ncbi:MAG: N-acetylmuramoyl-L-alanine amidase [Bacteroidota bacterium]|nr:N-acetylmuramoyl-L-alanine amidase [Bacteroidota bacterium]
MNHRIIVVHWTGLKDLDASHRVMNEPTLSESRTDIKSGGVLNVSAHYLVDRTGEIYRMLPDTIFARHAIGINYYAIGIENVGDGKSALTFEQLTANVYLIKLLKEIYL